MQIPGKQLLNMYTFKKGNLFLYNDVVVGEINEGAHVSSEILLSFFDFFTENYKTPFGYISYRKNSYSIDPQIYKLLPKNKLLKGIAIVSDQKFSTLNAQVEKTFFNGRFEVFPTLNAAVHWLDTIIPLENDLANISDSTHI